MKIQLLSVPAMIACACVFVSRPASAQVAGADPKDEIKQLFKKVEKDLQEIDKLLLDASSESHAAPSDAKTAATEANGKQKEVSDSIQKILDLIPEGGGSCCKNPSNHGLKKPGDNSQGKAGSQGQQPQNSQPKPGDQPKGQQEDEKTAQNAGQAPTMPKPANEKPDADSNPESPKKSNLPAEQKSGKPRDYATERANRGHEATDRWGDLPEHVQRAFSNENTDDLPMRYRKWVQDFYVRMSKSQPTAGK